MSKILTVEDETKLIQPIDEYVSAIQKRSMVCVPTAPIA